MQKNQTLKEWILWNPLSLFILGIASICAYFIGSLILIGIFIADFKIKEIVPAFLFGIFGPLLIGLIGIGTENKKIDPRSFIRGFYDAKVR